jgi:hypothetical protein
MAGSRDSPIEVGPTMPVSSPRLRKPLLLTLVVAMSPLRGSVAHADPTPPPAWEKIDDDDGITVYRREVPGSPIIAFKGEGVVNASILRVASVLIDTSRATEWIDSLAEARTLKQIGEDEYIEYDHVSTPFVLKDRDFVIDAKLEVDPAQKKVALMIHSVTDPQAPETNYVRGELMRSSFTLTALDHGQKTHVVAEIHADPKGSVAKWIVNMFQKGWPHNTITRLREQVRKPDIRDHAHLKEVLTDKGYFQ